MLSEIGRVLNQLDDGRLQWVVLKSALATIVLLAGLVAVLAWLTQALVATGIGWLDPLLPWLTGAGGLIAAIFLLPVATIAVMGLFADEVAAAVERRHYPDWPPGTPQGVFEGLAQTLRLLAAAIVLNLVALPFYLLLPGANLLIFLALNGYLLGREYFEAVAQRRLGAREVRALRRRHRGRVFAAGVAIAGLALLPIANLLVPVVGVALMVHRCAGLPEVAKPGTMTRRKV